MASREVVSLDNERSIVGARVGPKAQSLMRMRQLGLPVPPAFCIAGNAFHEHLEKNHLLPLIRATLKRLEGASSEVKASLLSDLRVAIAEAPMVDGLRQEIQSQYRALGAESVAVRSSATVEDLPGYSFAGQYESYLCIADFESCLQAIKRCWASLWTERAYDYRERNGFAHLSVEMAVIVQTMVLADASGVLFTADPVTGSRDRLIIEACPGLGQPLLSGRVTPDRILVSKKGLRILSQTISEKRLWWVPGKAGGVEERSLPVERASTSSVDRRTVQRLAKWAKRAETALGSPQDMEWAVRGRKPFFLQCRPITALPGPRSWEDRQVWTNANLGEVVPDVVTPVDWWLVRTLGSAIFESVFDWIGIDLGDNPLIGRVAGRAYFNMNTFSAALKHFPGLRKMDMSQVLGGEQGRMTGLGQLAVPDEDIPDLRFSRLKMLVRLPNFAFRILVHSPKRGEEFVARMRERGEGLLRLARSSLSESELVAQLRSGVQDIYRSVHGIAFSGLGMFHFTRLDKLCREWLGDTDGTFANRLLAGVGDMEIAQAGLDLWRLASKAHKHPEVEEIILRGEQWPMVQERLAKARGGDEFLSDWGRFMMKHGHHTRGELEVYNPRWSEMPDYVLDTVRSYLQRIEGESVLERHEGRAREREELALECRRRLRNPFRRWLFDFYLRQAQSGCLLRENIKSVAVLYWAGMRFLLLELGERLAKKRILEDRDGIFFLEFHEIEGVGKNEARFDLRATIAARRADYERNLTITPPNVVVGRFDPKTFVPEGVDGSLDTLSGIAVYPGVVTGLARVILKTHTEERIFPGEILVAPFTDPGWTPYLLPAAAIVVDQGGLLSHGSIIAREYGIPTVVNVGPASKLIKTGQTIQVDGNRGIVRILR